LLRVLKLAHFIVKHFTRVSAIIICFVGLYPACFSPNQYCCRSLSHPT